MVTRPLVVAIISSPQNVHVWRVQVPEEVSKLVLVPEHSSGAVTFSLRPVMVVVVFSLDTRSKRLENCGAI